RFELHPLGIRQDLHRLSTPMPNKISRLVTAASHQLRTDPSLDAAIDHSTRTDVIRFVACSRSNIADDRIHCIAEAIDYRINGRSVDDEWWRDKHMVAGASVRR